MTLAETLIAVWQQVLAEGKTAVELEGRRYPVGHTRARKLRTVDFSYGTHRLAAIEQNPETKSRWAALARKGKRILQFNCEGRYIGNVCEGRLMRYPAWKDLRLT
ncbi:MAG: hypothetical protein HYY26_04655 [Acidobacteria bacterium]|nr:hypothetical protein [Acidobacteriota bacterium]